MISHASTYVQTAAIAVLKYVPTCSPQIGTCRSNVRVLGRSGSSANEGPQPEGVVEHELVPPWRLHLRKSAGPQLPSLRAGVLSAGFPCNCCRVAFAYVLRKVALTKFHCTRLPTSSSNNAPSTPSNLHRSADFNRFSMGRVVSLDFDPFSLGLSQLSGWPASSGHSNSLTPPLHQPASKVLCSSFIPYPRSYYTLHVRTQLCIMNQPSRGPMTPRRNPRRAAATRQNSFPAPSPSSPTPPARVTRSSVRQHLPGDSADEEESSSDELSLSDDEPFIIRPSRLGCDLHTIASTRERRSQHHSTRQKAGSSRTKRSTAKPMRHSPRKGLPNKNGGSPRKRSPAVDQSTPWPTSKVIPPWQQLEWTILVQIFEYAAFPLDEKSNVRWLLSAGLACKAFLSPALKALYKCPMPQTISINMGNKFAGLIRDLAANAEVNDNRRGMVESLVIEISSLPLHSQARNFNVAELISCLPNLSYVELYHEFDLPPYRQLDRKSSKKWTYTPELLDALKAAGESDTRLRLKSWKWSERLMGPSLLEELYTIHTWNTFSQLRKLSFVNFQVPSLKEDKDPSIPEVFETDKSYINLVAASLSSVVGLKHLVMESSTAMDGQFLSLLPKTIEHLEIINCWELTAEMLSEYLLTHGRNLRRLTLHHNQSLNLSFVPLLGACCPELRELSMNLLTYNHHEYYKDSDPMYETLLGVTDVPTWPRTLELIDLEQLAKWDLATAEMFFQSFVNQAPQLPRLRHLAVKAMLDVPWRQRSEFRDKWVRKLKRVFFRKTAKPRPFHSLTQWPLSGNELGEQPNKPADDRKEEQDAKLISPRRSHRIATHVPAAPPVIFVEGHENKRKRKESTIITSDRHLRQRKRVCISYRDPDTDEDLSEEDYEVQNDRSHLSSPPPSPNRDNDDEEGDGGLGQTESFIHGLCDVVNIRFDNQKPREFQYGLEDFLDEETHSSEDAEWTSDVEEDEETYAW